MRAGRVTVAFLPFFHIYGMTVLMNLYLALGAVQVTLPRFDLEAFLQLTRDPPDARRLFVGAAGGAGVGQASDGRAVRPVRRSSIVLSGAAPLGRRAGGGCAARIGCARRSRATA